MLSQPHKEQPSGKQSKIHQCIPENGFNKITYIQYIIPPSLGSFEIDYLLDYSKILNTRYNDTKLLDWQNSNLESLKGTGLNESILLKRAEKKLKEKNSLSYYDYTIKNLNYRLERHGKLAPSNEIVKKYNKFIKGKFLSEINKNTEKKNEDYYDGEDDFIDDTLDKSFEEEKNLIFQITLPPGNYTEQEIIENLNKNEKTISKINDNNILSDIVSRSDGTPYKRDKKLLSQKTERDGNITEKKLSKTKLFNYKELNDLSFQKINYLVDRLIKQYDGEINTEYDKGNFIRRNIRNIRELDVKKKYELRKVIADKFNISLKIINYLLDFEIFKSYAGTKNGIFTKYFGNVLNILTEKKIFKVNNLNELIDLCCKDKDFQKNLDTVVKTIVEYRKEFNNYIGVHYFDLKEINKELKIFVKDIKEKNKEYIIKISTKLEESIKKSNIQLQVNDLIKYIKMKYSNIYFGEDFSDDNKRIYSLESFLDSSLGKKTKIFEEEDFENTKIKKEDRKYSNKTSQNSTPNKLMFKVSSPFKNNNINCKIETTRLNSKLNIKKEKY